MEKVVGIRNHILRSAQYRDSRKSKGEDPARKGSDPQVSFVCVVCRLARWAGCSAEVGGLKTAGDRDAAKRVLASLSTAGAGQPWHLGLFFELSSWVDGVPCGESQVSWHVSELGGIKLHVDGRAAKFVGALPGLASVDTVLDLLLFLVQSPRHIDLFKQVVVQVARRWELRLLMQAGGETHPACRVKFGLGHDDGNLSRHAISRRLVRYWADGRAWAPSLSKPPGGMSWS